MVINFGAFMFHTLFEETCLQPSSWYFSLALGTLSIELPEDPRTWVGVYRKWRSVRPFSLRQPKVIKNILKCIFVPPEVNEVLQKCLPDHDNIS